jgi:hypothetical protein
LQDVLEATRQQLERELSLEDLHGIQDLPAFTASCTNNGNIYQAL